jgi:hypothetical protein
MLSRWIAKINRHSSLGPAALIVCLLTVGRNPSFFIAPRIWAEEGSVYLKSALETGSATAFFQSHLGYYSLFNKLVILAGTTLFPLDYLAYVTTGISAVLQLCTSFVIYESTGRLGDGKLKRLLYCLLPLLLSTPEAWLNSINCQFWLATGTFFILNSRKISFFQAAYIGMAFMTGVSSLIFLPFFIGRLLKEKTSSLYAIILMGAISVPVQIASVFNYVQLEAGNGDRFKLEYFANFLGGVISTASPFGGSNPVLTILYFLLVTAGLYYFAKSLLDKRDCSGLVYTLGALSLYILLSVFSSLQMLGGGRYGLPVYSGLFAIAISAAPTQESISNAIIDFIKFSLLILLALKAITFFDVSSVYSANWPMWQKQVQARSCKNPSDIKIFPRWEGVDWKVTIPTGAGIECR